jgi:alkanesulfonate monooxygenase SsuD/methylene tetrahydromethanopterin reductase-like flavin-dependent oxidoreductase (luciferase family)
VQGTLPLLVGGGGEQRTLRIAAKYADEWNCWGTPEVLTHKMAVLDRHCEEVGRDPSTIQRSGQVLLFMSENPSFLARVRDLELPNPAAIGTPAEIGDTLHAYAEAGLDEFVVNDAAFRADGAARFDSMDRIREVATAATTGR